MSYAVPIVLAIGGFVAAIAAWKFHGFAGKPRK